MMGLHWALAAYCFLLVHSGFTGVHGDAFTSTWQLKAMVPKMDDYIDLVEEYIEREEKALNSLKDLLGKTEDLYAWMGTEDGQLAINHPNTVFHVVRKTSLLNENVVVNASLRDYHRRINKQDLPRLAKEEESGAASGIIRLQRVYNITVEQIAAGVITDEQGEVLCGSDFYSLGRAANTRGEFALSQQWLQLVLNQTTEMMPETLHEARISLAQVSYKMKDYEVAVEHMEQAFYENPHNQKVANVFADYKVKNWTMERTLNASDGGPASLWQRNTSKEFSTYEALCRGDAVTGSDGVPGASSIGTCRYIDVYGGYSPFKQEILSTDPFISVVYEVMSDYELKHFINKAVQDGMVRSKVKMAGGMPSHMRISSQSWLYDNKSAIVRRVSRRIHDITGLRVQSAHRKIAPAEPYQVVNYGLGGQYEPHWDESTPGGRVMARRIATFMIYLSDVSDGGATVFPKLNIRVPPIKGSAAFWYNLKRSGKIEPATRHAGCPVLRGEKWVTNKWIHYEHQMDSTPCGLAENDLHV